MNETMSTLKFKIGKNAYQEIGLFSNSKRVFPVDEHIFTEYISEKGISYKDYNQLIYVLFNILDYPKSPKSKRQKIRKYVDNLNKKNVFTEFFYEDHLMDMIKRRED